MEVTIGQQRVQLRIDRGAPISAGKELCPRPGREQNLVLHRAQHGEHRAEERRVGFRRHEPAARRVAAAGLRVQPRLTQLQRAQDDELPLLLQRPAKRAEHVLRGGLIRAQKRHAHAHKFDGEENAVLSAGRGGVGGQMAADLRVGQLAAQKLRLSLHAVFRAAAVAIRDPVIIGHARVHLRVFRVRAAGGAVEHHED